jgi:hypothetical protein
MGGGTQAPVGDEHVSRLQARVDRLHPGEIVGEERRDHPLQEHPGAGMKQPQEPGDGKASPWPRLRRLAAHALKGRRTQAWSIPSHRRGRCDDYATALHLRRIVARRY